MVEYLQPLRGLVLPTMPLLRCAEPPYCAALNASHSSVGTHATWHAVSDVSMYAPTPYPRPRAILPQVMAVVLSTGRSGRRWRTRTCETFSSSDIASSRRCRRSVRSPYRPCATHVSQQQAACGKQQQAASSTKQQQQAATGSREQAATLLSCRIEAERSPSPAGCMRAFLQHVPA